MSERQLNILVASDSFKGTYSSKEIIGLVADALPQHKVTGIAISDGGEGFCDAAYDALGGELVSIRVHDPLMRLTTARYLICGNGMAVIEMAQAAGLTLLSSEERNPWITTTFGVGELIYDAICRGCTDIVVGLGGSASNDCGRGMIEFLTGHTSLLDSQFRLKQHITIASDVTNPLCGANGAAYVFAGQKGADERMKEQLDARNLLYGRYLEQLTGKELIERKGTGAAGGLGAALLAISDAVMQSGIELMLEWQDFERLAGNADIVITGEGCLDRQTLMGKAPYVIAEKALHIGKPCIALCGRCELSPEDIEKSPFSKVVLLKDFHDMEWVL